MQVKNFSWQSDLTVRPDYEQISLVTNCPTLHQVATCRKSSNLAFIAPGACIRNVTLASPSFMKLKGEPGQKKQPSSWIKTSSVAAAGKNPKVG
jgi:hypothetical protein